MAKETMKSPSSEQQKAQALVEEFIMWEEAVDPGLKKIRQDCAMQPTLDGNPHPIELQLSNAATIQTLRENTRCKQEWNKKCKAASDQRLANVAHSSSSTKLAAQHPRNLDEKIAADVIRWAVEHYRKHGCWPLTDGQKDKRELKRAREKIQRLEGDNEQLRKKLKLKDTTAKESAIANHSPNAVETYVWLSDEDEDPDPSSQLLRSFTPPPDDNHL